MMIPVEALKMAVSKEKEAMCFYKELSTQYPVLKETFLFLINEEEKHKKLLEAKISELTRY